MPKIKPNSKALKRYLKSVDVEIPEGAKVKALIKLVLGHWEEEETDTEYKCDECGNDFPEGDEITHCPFCGVSFDDDDEDEEDDDEKEEEKPKKKKDKAKGKKGKEKDKAKGKKGKVKSDDDDDNDDDDEEKPKKKKGKGKDKAKGKKAKGKGKSVPAKKSKPKGTKRSRIKKLIDDWDGQIVEDGKTSFLLFRLGVEAVYMKMIEHECDNTRSMDRIRYNTGYAMLPGTFEKSFSAKSLKKHVKQWQKDHDNAETRDEKRVASSMICLGGGRTRISLVADEPNYEAIFEAGELLEKAIATKKEAQLDKLAKKVLACFGWELLDDE